MGAASYREDDLTRFLEATEAPVVPTGPAPPRNHCPLCAKYFVDRHFLSDHLSTEHRGSRPVLLIEGVEPDQTSTIRQRVHRSRVSVENCSEVRIRIDGTLLDHLTPTRVPELLCGERNSIVELEMVNRFDRAAAPISQHYRLEMRIPEKRSLDLSDRAFIQHLAHGGPHMSQVAAFHNDQRCKGSVSDYSEALGAFVRGVLIKDQAVNTGVTLSANEANDLFGRAVDGLKGFRRPLPAVVCGLIRFAFNDFSCVARPTGFPRLDRCNRVFGALLGFGTPPVARTSDENGGGFASLCPIDQATDSVLDLADRLDRQTRWGPKLSEDCQQAAAAQSLTADDRDKVLCLWAATAWRLKAPDASIDPLRRLRATHSFGAWASERLDEMEGNSGGE